MAVARAYSVSPITTLARWPSSSAQCHWPAFSAMARSARWARTSSCTASLPRWDSSCRRLPPASKQRHHPEGERPRFALLETSAFEDAAHLVRRRNLNERRRQVLVGAALARQRA